MAGVGTLVLSSFSLLPLYSQATTQITIPSRSTRDPKQKHILPCKEKYIHWYNISRNEANWAKGSVTLIKANHTMGQYASPDSLEKKARHKHVGGRGPLLWVTGHIPFRESHMPSMKQEI